MTTLRACSRAVLLAAWTATIVTLLLLGALPAVLSRVTWRRWHVFAFRTWARGTARIVGLRIAATGNRPRGAFFLVANHLSYLDVVVLASLVDATFVAKADVAGWPAIGTLCRLVGTVFIERTRRRDLLRVIPLLEQHLGSGAGVVVFPEGTTSDGRRVLEFKSPLFEAAVRARRPAHVASLSYATPPNAPHPAHAVCWWGDMTFGPHLFDLLRLPRLTASVSFAPAPVLAEDRKHLARAARAAVERHFIPVTRGEIACLPVPGSPTPTSASFARTSSC